MLYAVSSAEIQEGKKKEEKVLYTYCFIFGLLFPIPDISAYIAQKMEILPLGSLLKSQNGDVCNVIWVENVIFN